MNKRLLNLLLALIMLAVLVPTALAAPTAQEAGQDYVVVADDWLSKLADKYLGNPMAYPAIVEYTNQKHAEDASYAEITDPDLIEVGWKIYIPSAEEATEFIAVAVPPSEPKALTLGGGAGDPESIDPQGAVDTTDYAFANMQFVGLVIQDEVTKEMVKAMATSWDISEDGTEYTFHLMEKVPWVRYNPDTDAVEQVMDENGNPRYVTAHDFVYGFTRALDPEVAAPTGYILAPFVVGGEAFAYEGGSAEDLGLEAVDDYTFKIKAPEKVAFLLGIYGVVCGKAVPQWAIEESGDVWTEPENANVYGPFVLKEWVHDGSLTFVKNPFWPGSEGVQQAGIDEITFLLIDADAALREYEAGKIDTAYVPSDEIARIRADPTLSAELTTIADLCTQAWDFNLNKPPLDNVHIRRAFSYAVDRKTLVEDVLGGGQVVGKGYTPPGVYLSPTEDAGFVGIQFDPAKAQEELALGLEELGLASVDELPAVTVEFGTSTELKNVAQALQVMWRDTLGIEVALAEIDNAVYWAKQREDAGQIARGGWCPDYNDASNYLLDTFRSDSPYNGGGFANEEFDRLVDEAQVLDDAAKRLELYTRAEELLLVEDPGTMVLYYPANNSVTQPYLQRTFAPTRVNAYWKWTITD